MKLLTKLKLRLEGVIKSVNLDWRVVAVELNEDLLEERKRRFMCEQENYDRLLFSRLRKKLLLI